MNKNIIIGIVVVIVILIGGGVYWFMQGQNTTGSLYGAPSSTVPIVSGPMIPANPSLATTTNPSPTPVPTQTQTSLIPTVTIQNFAFSPASITIKKGETITWTNKDSMGHTVTGNNGGPASPTIGTNEVYSFTFNSVGTFPYHCAIHPSMVGTVTVTP